MKNGQSRLVCAMYLAAQLLLICSSSFANDSIGSVAVGGITFVKSQNIRLLREDLHISPETIHVFYKSRNESAHDIHATVAFPMPPYGRNPGKLAGTLNERSLNNFSVQVDGHPIVARVDRRAMVGGKDVTASLRGLGLTDEQIYKTFATCMTEDDDTEYFCGVTKAQKNALEQMGRWKASDTALWPQTFPAHREISIRHEYPPLRWRVLHLPLPTRAI